MLRMMRGIGMHRVGSWAVVLCLAGQHATGAAQAAPEQEAPPPADSEGAAPEVEAEPQADSDADQTTSTPEGQDVDDSQPAVPAPGATDALQPPSTSPTEAAAVAPADAAAAAPIAAATAVSTDGTASTPASAAEAAPADEEEIIITADRRASNLQDYPGSVSALGQQQLDAKGINSVRGLTAATPYVQLGTQEGNTEVFIRGVGSNNNTELGDPAAAMHFDGIYIPRPRGVGSMLYDVERVEISRGPQGTLRGRNATAGAVNVVTRAPELEEWDGGASVQLGNYMQRLGKVMVNVPIGEQLAVRLAAYHETRDPFYTNAGPVWTLKPAESADTLSYRASALWQPLDAFKLVIRHDNTFEGGTGNAGSNYHPALTANVLPKDIPDPRNIHYRGPQGSQDMNHWGVSADASAEFGPLNVGYLGSYRALDYQQVVSGNAGVDYPGMATPDYDNWGGTYWHTTSKSIVQELRLYSPDTDRLRWNVGGFFFQEEQEIFLGGNGDKSDGWIGFEYNHPDMKSTSYAGFADATYDILEFLRATLGVRYTRETKRRNGIGHQYGLSGLADGESFRFGTEGFQFAGLSRTDFSAGSTNQERIDNFLNGVARFGVRDTLRDALNQPGVTLNDSLAEQHGDYSGDFIDFRVGGAYDLTDDNLLYVMVSTGHQSGGFNDTINDPNNPGKTIAPEYDPEALYSTEVGSKNRFMDGALTANVAAFWYHYVNQQFSRVQALGDAGDDGNAAGTLLKDNLGTSRVLGLEADVIANLPAGFALNLAGMLLNARITDAEIADTRLSGSPADAEATDLSGNFLPRAPVLSVNYGLSQTIYTSIGRFYWRVAARTKTKQYMDVFNGDGHDADGNVVAKLAADVPSYTIIDAGLGYTRPDGSMSLELLGTNLSDTTYLSTLNNSANHDNRYFNAPRQLAVRATVQL